MDPGLSKEDGQHFSDAYLCGLRPRRGAGRARAPTGLAGNVTDRDKAGAPVARALQVLQEVGLGYLRLGQAATELSGGEAQRMKLARELSKRQTGKTLYLLDEPTTGLHFDDVRRLLEVLHRLADLGNTVIIIEHNLDVIRSADWILDLGPEGGEGGGNLVAKGTPGQVAATLGSHTGEFLRRYFPQHELKPLAVQSNGNHLPRRRAAK